MYNIHMQLQIDEQVYQTVQADKCYDTLLVLKVLEEIMTLVNFLFLSTNKQELYTQKV